MQRSDRQTQKLEYRCRPKKLETKQCCTARRPCHPSRFSHARRDFGFSGIISSASSISWKLYIAFIHETGQSKLHELRDSNRLSQQMLLGARLSRNHLGLRRFLSIVDRQTEHTCMPAGQSRVWHVGPKILLGRQPRPRPHGSSRHGCSACRPAGTVQRPIRVARSSNARSCSLGRPAGSDTVHGHCGAFYSAPLAPGMRVLTSRGSCWQRRRCHTGLCNCFSANLVERMPRGVARRRPNVDAPSWSSHSEHVTIH